MLLYFILELHRKKKAAYKISDVSVFDFHHFDLEGPDPKGVSTKDPTNVYKGRVHVFITSQWIKRLLIVPCFLQPCFYFQDLCFCHSLFLALVLKHSYNGVFCCFNYPFLTLRMALPLLTLFVFAGGNSG